MRSWPCLLVNTAQSSFVLPARGLKAVLIPREGRVLTVACACVCVYTHARTHTLPPPPNKQKAKSKYMTRNPDIHSWNCFSFPSVVPGFLLERVLYREAVFPTLGLIFRLCVALGLVLIRGRFYPKHFWLKYVRNWRVVAERRSWGWQEGLKKDSICHRTPSS